MAITLIMSIAKSENRSTKSYSKLFFERTCSEGRRKESSKKNETKAERLRQIRRNRDLILQDAKSSDKRSVENRFNAGTRWWNLVSWRRYKLEAERGDDLVQRKYKNMWNGSIIWRPVRVKADKEIFRSFQLVASERNDQIRMSEIEMRWNNDNNNNKIVQISIERKIWIIIIEMWLKLM